MFCRKHRSGHPLCSVRVSCVLDEPDTKLIPQNLLPKRLQIPYKIMLPFTPSAVWRISSKQLRKLQRKILTHPNSTGNHHHPYQNYICDFCGHIVQIFPSHTCLNLWFLPRQGEKENELKCLLLLRQCWKWFKVASLKRTLTKYLISCSSKKWKGVHIQSCQVRSFNDKLGWFYSYDLGVKSLKKKRKRGKSLVPLTEGTCYFSLWTLT